MVLNVTKRVPIYCSALFNKTARFYSIYEPPYLKCKEPEVPICPVLNIQLRGYKYPLLESYQSFIHKLAKVLQFTVDDSFPFPHREYKIQRYKSASTIVDAEYNLRIYERDMQISNVTSIKCPIIIRILEATLPEGVSLSIENYDPILQKKRVIPNKMLLDLKESLEELKQK